MTEADGALATRSVAAGLPTRSVGTRFENERPNDWLLCPPAERRLGGVSGAAHAARRDGSTLGRPCLGALEAGIEGGQPAPRAGRWRCLFRAARRPMVSARQPA